MQKSKMALAALILAVTAMLAVGCTKPDGPGNGGNGGNNIGNDGDCTYNGHEYVDLGLPSGTFWATCNVGATVPAGYGDYFAWGETSPKDIYSWSTYMYANGSYLDVPRLIKYCNWSSYGDNGFTDTLAILLSEDDAATANWGGGWCMPTADQWRELRDNTITEWTTKNGVEGRLLTAPNGNSLFLPAAGYRTGGSLSDVGSRGYYWSSTLYSDSLASAVCAWCIGFHSDGYGMDHDLRRCGRSVRAVRSTAKN